MLCRHCLVHASGWRSRAPTRDPTTTILCERCGAVLPTEDEDPMEHFAAQSSHFTSLQLNELRKPH